MNRLFTFYRNLTIRKRLIISVLFISIAVLIGVSGYAHMLYKAALKKESIAYLQTTALKYAGDIGNYFEDALSTTQSLSLAFSQMVASGMTDRKMVGDIVKNETKRQENFASVWALWEPNAFDGKDHLFINDENNYSNSTGRFVPNFFKRNGQVLYTPIIEEELGDYYFQEIRKAIVYDPEYYTYGSDLSLKTFAVEYPIILNDTYLGLVGVDIVIDRYEDLIESVKPYPSTLTQIIGTSGDVVLHPDATAVDHPFVLKGTDLSAADILKEGFDEVLIETKIEGKRYFNAFAPVKIGDTGLFWTICITVPEEEVFAAASEVARIWALLCVLGIALLLISVVAIINTILHPVEGATKVLMQIASGNIGNIKQLSVKNNDEVGKMSQAINTIIVGLQGLLRFAKEIGRGNYFATYQTVNTKDELVHEMMTMRDNLLAVSEKEKQFKEEDEQRSWVNRGLADFSEIMRSNSHDLMTLSYQVISKLVKYLNANQGGMFVVNDEDPDHIFLELTACYAYERRKYQKKTIEIGEGLVGTCYQEGETIYMNDIPEDYIHITSGIGEATPRAIIIVPMKVDNVIYGVMEIATFKDILPYQIDFLEKIGTNTASTISNVKINLQTKYLLEQSQMQAQKLSEQEEEMRQNMEEMQVTQEEMSRQNQESERARQSLSDTLHEMEKVQKSLEDEKNEVQSLMQAVDNVFMRITYDADMTLLDINEQCLAFHGMKREDMIGIKLTQKMNPADIPAFEENWAKVLKGEIFKGDGVRKTSSGDKHVWYMYTPIKDASGKVNKVLMLGRFLEDM